ncbi:MAG: acyl-CoA carboxylase subunit beta [Alphaproteobacteria bacterium]|nr:acyl-CoA carboxylase subunit beta [Alphaproteobacteria bacterium]MCB9796345.1 acyl-CoA carboxylase subunit beta [Alphaproteobacteria bacterium]
MRAWRSRVDPRSAEFRQRHAENLQAVALLEAALAEAREGGGPKYKERHVARGRMLPRERVEALLDPDGYFLELCSLAGKELAPQAGASLIGGVGLVNGVECMIMASDSTVRGGAINESGVKKTRRLAEIAAENHLPGVSLIESAGADLPNQSKIFIPGGEGFRDITQRSKERIPSVCLVFGSSTAGGAYIPGMSDYAVFVKEQAQVYLAGPPLVKMATGEVVDDESLGGAEMHSRVSGVSDFLAEDELDAIRIGRDIIGALRWRRQGPPPTGPGDAPLYSPDELLGVVPSDFRQAVDAREIIARVVDGSRFLEFKPDYGSTLVTAYADVHGYRVGILANNGILFSESANKGAQFIALCNQQHIPLIFLQNITGFMVGEAYERGGIIKNGAKMINAVSNSTVPAITIMTGASFGAGNYAMMGRAYNPRFLFTWPSHRIAVMGGEQLAGVLDIIKRRSALAKGQELNEEGLAMVKAMIQHQIEQESSPYFATARLWDDGIIDPRDTRAVLGICLSATHNAPVSGTTSWGIYRH